MKIAIKRTLIMVLMILMVITLVPNAGLGGKVYAESVYKHFTVGEFDYYESDITDGYASASGYSKGVGVSTYNGSGANVTIPRTVEFEGVTYAVTVVSQDSFSWNDVVETVQIPGSVLSIEWLAFTQCPSLTDIIFIAMATVNFRIIASVIIMTAKRMNISGPGILFFTDIIQTNT